MSSGQKERQNLVFPFFLLKPLMYNMIMIGKITPLSEAKEYNRIVD